MKRRIMALLLAATLVFQGVSTVPVFASETVGETFDVTAKEMFVTLETGDVVTLEADVTAPEGAELSYSWSAMNAQYEEVELDGDTCTYEITGAPGMYTTYYCDVTCNGGDPMSASFYVTFINIISGLTEETPAEHTFAQQGEQVYFEFVPETTGRYVFSAEGSQLQPALYNAEMSKVQSGSGTNTGFVFETEELTEGTTYYLGVRAYVPGAMTVSVETFKLSATTEESDVTVLYGNENTVDLVVDVFNATEDEETYAWYKDGAEEAIDGETASTLTVNGDLETAGEYKCVVTCGDIEKEVLFNVTVSTELSVNAADGLSFYLIKGESTTLEVEATGLKDPISYQWGYMDPETYEDIDIEGATDTSYTVVKDSDVEVLYYYCKVTDGVAEEKVTYIINGVNGNYTFGNEIELPLSMVESQETLTYKFVPTATATYKFVSEGTGYPQMMIKDAAGEYLAESSSIDSPYVGLDEPNLNFELSIDLEKDTTYYLVFRMDDSTSYSPVEPSDAVVKATVSNLALEDCEIEVKNPVYDGTAQEAEVIVKFGNQVFESEVDYHVEYSYSAIHPMTGMPMDMQEPAVIGEGKVTVYPLEGALTGEFFGVSKQYTVEKANLANATVVLEDVAYTYDGNAKTPAVESVKIGDLTLTEDDYTVTHDKNTNAGTAKVIITAKENSEYYTGSIVKEFNIAAASITNADVILDKTEFVYNGKAQAPKVTVKLGGAELKEGTDYTVEVKDNVAVGEKTVKVVGKGNYTGTAELQKFVIKAATITKDNVTINPTNFTYTGTAQNPGVIVKVGGATLKENTDYTVAVANGVNKGTYTVKVTGKGNYTGTVDVNYTINAASIANADVTIASVKYTGKALEPAVTVVVGGKTLVAGTDYTVTYSNNTNIGNGKVTITGKGNYEGNISKTFAIAVKKGDTFTVGAYNYEVTGSSTVAFAGVVKSKVSKTTTVKVADTVKIGGKTFKVTSIVDNALKNNKKVKKVTIGKNVTTIGKSAFEGCTKLSTVTIGANVTKIGDKAFKKCTALKKITIPAKVKTIGKEVFSGCKNLKTITIKSTKLTSVGKNALKGINSKATIKVPSKKLSAYKKLLKGTGQGSKVTIKK